MTTSRSECVRGCMKSGVHFASCEDRIDAGGTCTGCAPEAPVEGLVVCGECRRRVRGLLRIAPDLLGRMRSLAAQGKAAVYSPVKVFGAPAMAPDQVDAELADALIEISANVAAWSRWIDMRTLGGLDRVLADADQTHRLAVAVIDRHTVEEEGGRRWSIADAAARWGVERRDRTTFVYQEDADEVEQLITPIHESRHDPLLTARDAAKLAQISDRQLRSWVSAGAIAPQATLRDGRGVMMRWYRRSEVIATAERMRAAATATWFAARKDTPA